MNILKKTQFHTRLCHKFMFQGVMELNKDLMKILYFELIRNYYSLHETLQDS